MEDLLEANRVILQGIGRQVAGQVDAKSSVVGDVVLAESASVINSVLRGPLIVGDGTTITDCYVGPFTAVDHHCRLSKCEIHHSIVMDHSTIEDIPTPIESSIIGRNARMRRVDRRPHAYRLTLGDYSEIEVP
jgi:glucose-1-phosphate thymidylyltransferase